ncbi:MAG: VOC family protein, partial [Alphaproteobacteria bacterium]
MSGTVLINIDVGDLDRAVAFYRDGLGLAVGRRLEPDFVELRYGDAHLYLLVKGAGSEAAPGGATRNYGRHWTPVHLDFVVDDIAAAITRAVGAGARVEREPFDEPYGKLALLSDPFGHGFCLIEFNEKGYDALMPE